VERNKYTIQIPLPPKIDPNVTMMTVEEKPDVTYEQIGGLKEQLERLKEVVELPLLHPERFVKLGIDPPKGVLLYGPPGTVHKHTHTLSLSLSSISFLVRCVFNPNKWHVCFLG
jgi:ATP-dependent 26S proteasome regulatory subunit